MKHKLWCLCRFFKRKNRFPSREILYSPQLRPLIAFPNLDITIIMIWEQLIAPLIKKSIVAWWSDSHKIEGAHRKSFTFISRVLGRFIQWKELTMVKNHQKHVAICLFHVHFQNNVSFGSIGGKHIYALISASTFWHRIVFAFLRKSLSCWDTLSFILPLHPSKCLHFIMPPFWDVSLAIATMKGVCKTTPSLS